MMQIARSRCKLSRETRDGSYLYSSLQVTSTRTDTRSSLQTKHSSMKVLGANKFGRKHLSFVPDHPEPSCESPTDVLIKVEFSDLNPVDHHKINSKPVGTPTPSNRTPFVVGFGGSGVVESVSENADEHTCELLNKRVVFIADPARDGSYAQYIVCDRRLVTVLPEDIASHEAACIPIAGCTAYESIEKVGLSITSSNPSKLNNHSGEDQRLLIVGGSGGVGSFITQLARSNYPKLDIVCTVGSEASSVWCRKMGCNKTIDHGKIDTLGGGPKGSCDYIICLAEPTQQLFASLAEVLRPYGKICLVVAGEGIQKLDMSFIFFKCGSVSTQTVFSSVRSGYHLDQAREMSIILELMRQKRIRAPLNECWNEAESDWKRCNEEDGYINAVGSGHTRGKLVMQIGD